MNENMQPIRKPVSRDLIKQELSQERFVRTPFKGDNEIYIINSHNSPNVMIEIGRLRELAFRTAGGGTGKEIDIDEYDTHEKCYEQLIVYNPEDEEIVGGYRFIDCGIAKSNEGQEYLLSTAHYFNFSDEFKNSYLPDTIELGRSFVQPKYQTSKNPRKGLYALANLWDGLGSLVILYPHIKYFFGKVTMYPDYDRGARDLLLSFMHYYFPDKDELVTPKRPLPFEYKSELIASLFKGVPFNKGINILKKKLKEKGESIPPLVNMYMGLSPSMKTFGTALNPEFGDVEETGIMVTIADIYEEKKERHVGSKED